MPKLTIDGIEVEVPAGSTVFQACEKAGVEIPHFCYHSRLNIAGNCRMCLVEQEGASKPIASCAMPAADNMIINTKSEKTLKARRGVMEFLLINHPLDCPICDQGGECDLQDQAMSYGCGTSRYEEAKRAVPVKNMGPLIKTFMNRCIHCTRCIRFATDVAGVPELGVVNRGEHMEITTYLDRTFSSEMSGNIVDLCPVGALTSLPYSFRGRPWELTKTDSIDVMDAVGSNIRVDAYGQKIMRILPRLNESINEEWISDKSRHACDGLGRQRLDQPYIRTNGKLQPAGWQEALSHVAKKLTKANPKEIGAIAGDLCDVESMFALKQLMTKLKVPNLDCRQDGAKISAEDRSHYLFNTPISHIEEADALLLIGAHPRLDAPIINTRILKRAREGHFPVARLGAKPGLSKYELQYPFEDLGNDPKTLEDIAAGKHPFAQTLEKAKKPLIIIGPQAYTRSDGDSILALAAKIAENNKAVSEKWNGFNVLHTAAARVGGLDIRFIPNKDGMDVNKMLAAAEKKELKILYLLGADELPMENLKNTFVIYQGHHGDKGAQHADVILPGAAYTEKDALYVNMEGRVQQAFAAVPTPGEAKEDWRILRALSDELEMPLPFNTQQQLRELLAKEYPTFGVYDEIKPAKWKQFGNPKKLTKSAIKGWDANFFMTDPISRHSVTMAKCSVAQGFAIQTERTPDVA